MSSDHSNDAAIVRLVTEIARGLVEDATAVRVEVNSVESTRVIRLRVGTNDFRWLLGSHGRTAKCIRTIVLAASHRLQQRYTLDIAEDAGTPPPKRSPTTSL